MCLAMRLCVETLQARDRNEKASHWPGVFLAGFSSEVVRKPLEVAETECATDGNKIREFEVKREI